MWGRHLLGYLPVNIVQAVVGFGGIYVLTRLLSPHDYGLYALALAATHFFHAPAFAWIEAAAARFHARAQRRGRLADHFAALIAMWTPTAALMAVLLTLGLWLAPIPAEIKTLAGFTGGALIARAAMKLLQETRRAAHDVSRYAFLECLYLLGSFALGAALILATPLRASGPFVGLLVAGVVCVALEAPFALRGARGGRPSALRAASYASYGAPIAISLVMALVVSVSDRFMIAGFLSEAEAGVYAAGYGLANRPLEILFTWVSMSAGPLAFAMLEREGGDSARRLIGVQGETMVLLVLPAAVGLALVAGPLAAVMTGEAFRDQAAAIIPWIAVAGFLAGFTTHYLDQTFELARKTWLVPMVLIAPALANIALNVILLPRLGITGAVVATVAAYAIGAVITAFVGLRQFPIPLPLSCFLRTGAACAIMAVVVLALPDAPFAWLDLIWKAGVGAAVFAPAALALDAGPARAFAAAALGRFAAAPVLEAGR